MSFFVIMRLMRNCEGEGIDKEGTGQRNCTWSLRTQGSLLASLTMRRTPALRKTRLATARFPLSGCCDHAIRKIMVVILDMQYPKRAICHLLNRRTSTASVMKRAAYSRCGSNSWV